MIKLDTYELKIDGIESYVDFISLVENPAIEKEFLAFSEQKKYEFSLNDEKMELIGAAMVPEQLIYRRNEDGYEYQVFFSKDTIRQISQNFFKSGSQSNLNIEHSAINADSYVFQSMIVDNSKGISIMDLPDGTWVVGVKVLNKSIWKDIKEGKRKGFSIEGIFDLHQHKFQTKKDDETEIMEMLQRLQNLLKGNI